MEKRVLTELENSVDVEIDLLLGDKHEIRKHATIPMNTDDNKDNTTISDIIDRVFAKMIEDYRDPMFKDVSIKHIKIFM